MIINFLKHSAIYGIGQVVSAVVGIISLPVITNALSPEEYGIFSSLNILLILLNLSVALEVSQSVARFMAEEKNALQKRILISTAFYFSFFAFSVTGIFLYIFSKPLSFMVFGAADYSNLIISVIPWLFLAGFHSFFINQYRWEGNPHKQITLVISRSLIFVCGVFYLLSGNIGYATDLILLHVVATFLAVVIGLYFSLSDKLIGLHFSIKKLKKMLIFSFPLVFSSLAIFAQSYIDRIMISQMLDLKSLGLYSLAFNIANIIVFAVAIFQMAVVPLVYKHYQDKDTPKNLGYAARIYAFFVLLSVLIIGLFLPEIFSWFIALDYHKAKPLTLWLLFSVCIYGFYVFAPGLSIAKKTGHIAIINITGMILNFVFNLIMIPKFGVIGAAVATTLATSIMCCVNVAFNQRYYKVEYGYLRVLTSLCLVLYVLIISINNSFFDSVFSRLSVAFVLVISLFFILIPFRVYILRFYKVK